MFASIAFETFLKKSDRPKASSISLNCLAATFPTSLSFDSDTLSIASSILCLRSAAMSMMSEDVFLPLFFLKIAGKFDRKLSQTSEKATGLEPSAEQMTTKRHRKAMENFMFYTVSLRKVPKDGLEKKLFFFFFFFYNISIIRSRKFLQKKMKT